MPPASRDPSELAQAMSRRLHRVRVANSLSADALLGWASWHLDTAQLGWDMFQRALPEGDQNLTGHTMHTVEIAAENLIFRGVVSAMDLCAAAVFRLTGELLRADRERDVTWTPGFRTVRVNTQFSDALFAMGPTSWAPCTP